MGTVSLQELTSYLDSYLRSAEIKDYPGAWNGLQVEGRPEVSRIAAAVDASVATVEEAARRNVDLLLTHHGLFWNSSRPLVGRALRRIAPLIRDEISVYSAHLPLDCHPEVGNNALLLRRIGFEPVGRFGESQGSLIGWYADMELSREELLRRVEYAIGQPARNRFFFGSEICRRVGVITGGAGSEIAAAAAAGVDFYVTGEGAQHTFFDAQELAINVVYAGHYATETFGVCALAQHLGARFGLDWEFIDLPTGL